MALKPLDLHFNAPMELPISEGKVYKLYPVNADTGVLVTAMMGIAARAQLGDRQPSAEEIDEILNKNEGQDSIHQQVLGDLYDELISDQVPFQLVQFISAVAVIWITVSKEAAEEFWNNGGRPKAPKKKPRDRARSAK